ncbi:MAG: S26 family signal peptidase [Bacteroidales bacterium]|jgi:signal peptidase I|nr:S26 family signal peptidase [Bacteroidales bacterium]
MTNKANKQNKATNDGNGQYLPRYLKIATNKYFKFGTVVLLYLLWTVWVGNWWLLAGVPVLFDIYITKKVNWTFWKKRKGPNSRVVEWIDALIFAVIAVTLINIFVFQNYKIPTGSMERSLQIGDHLFVSKLKYGPKIPNTPLSFPFAQHTMPLTKNVKSYLEWINWPYKRLKGFTRIKNDDIVVFNFPEGDTVIVLYQTESYYALLRRQAETLEDSDKASGREIRPFQYYTDFARKQILNEYDITVRPVDKRDNYIKRCVAIPGDTVRIVNARVHINGKPQKPYEHIQYRYAVQTDGSPINVKTLERFDIYRSDVRTIGNGLFSIPMIDDNVEQMRKLTNVRSVEMLLKPEGLYDSEVFPHDGRFAWNVDNFGPLWVPKKGVTVKIDTANISLYARIISAYEYNDLKVENGKIFINDVETDSYTFQMDYYWMMGDNRHDSLDSRFWGFVPEDHIVGAPRFVWLSLNKEKTFPFNIRLSRMFRAAGR